LKEARQSPVRYSWVASHVGWVWRLELVHESFVQNGIANVTLLFTTVLLGLPTVWGVRYCFLCRVVDLWRADQRLLIKGFSRDAAVL